MNRGVMNVADLRSRSTVDPHDRNPYAPCWHWQGAKAFDRTPRIYTIDFDRCEKRSMSGPKAVANISRGAGIGTRFAYRTCCSVDCVNPAHLALAASKAEIGAAIRLDGRRKGTALAARRANVVKAWAAAGITVAPPDVVRACRAAGPEVTNVALAALHGIQHTTVSRIRLGQSHRDVR